MAETTAGAARGAAGQGAAAAPAAARDTGADLRGHFIPLRKREILEALLDAPALPEGERDGLARIAHRLSLIFHLDFHAHREALKDLYARMNPDQPGDGALPVVQGDRDRLFAAVDEVLTAANFRPLDPGELASRRDSEGRVRARVKVPEELFAEVRLLARGWHRREIEVRRWFGLRRDRAQAEVFHDVVLIAAIRPDIDPDAARKARLRPGAVYLKYFRDIPRADLQTLYPNARVQMRLEDQLLIGVPAVVGGIPILINLGPALTVLLLVAGAWLGIAGTVQEDAMKQAIGALSGLGALGGFLARQWIKYERQKLKYQKQVAENAYFNNLGNNAGLFDMAVGASEDAEVKEAILAYAHLRMAGGALDDAALDVRIEDWLTRRFGVEVDFEIDDALAKLEALGLARREEGGLTAPDPDTALARLAEAWAARAEAALDSGARNHHES